jgi:hypothetical protein
MLANPLVKVMFAFLSVRPSLIDQDQLRYACLCSISLGETIRYFVVVINSRGPQFMQNVTSCFGTQSMWYHPAKDIGFGPHIYIYIYIYLYLYNHLFFFSFFLFLLLLFYMEKDILVLYFPAIVSWPQHN